MSDLVSLYCPCCGEEHQIEPLERLVPGAIVICPGCDTAWHIEFREVKQ